uniref:Sterol O-acyltransferase n=1 Tax=Timema douglasi TaxID=61478 RepID=A0A7R8ZBT1_TIMDO|nr:unnamed protein product [Timema douglasi]
MERQTTDRAKVSDSQVRLLMKSYAFVRSNVPKTMAFKSHTDSKEEGAPCPEFSCFLYYLFAPTLVYRDNYPRKKETNWLAVAWHFTEVIGVVFYVAFIFDRFLIPMFRDFGRKPLHPETLVVGVFGAMMPGTLAFLCGFFCLLHSWMNAFAEMLRFGDRMFYKDWWNATSYAAYYRTWNVVVHDWLYTYVYKDFCEVFQPKTHFVPTMLVFFVSAVVHEFILAFTFRFFYPMLLLAFGGFGALYLDSGYSSNPQCCMWELVKLVSLCCFSKSSVSTERRCRQWEHHYVAVVVYREWYSNLSLQHGVVRQDQLPTDAGPVLGFLRSPLVELSTVVIWK